MVIGGRVADVDLAVGQEEARALALAKVGERGPRDSRRLVLAKEGQIVEGSPAWEDMSAGDRAKRKRAAGAMLRMPARMQCACQPECKFLCPVSCVLPSSWPGVVLCC